MRGRRIAALALLVAMVAVGTAQAEWSGHRIRWRYYGGLQITEDAGKHWRTSVDLGYFEPIWVHLGARTGFIFAPDEDQDSRPYWTPDGGRQWYAAPGVDAPYLGDDWPPDFFSIDGTARFAYYTFAVWTEDAPTVGIYQIRPWPPTPASLRCVRWGRVAGFRAPVCVRPRSSLQGVKLATLPGFVEDGPSLVPGGIAQLVLDFDPAQPLARVYIRRNGRARLVALPLDATAAASLGGFKGGSLLAQWPELQVVISGKARTLVCRSEDGGATWQVF